MAATEPIYDITLFEQTTSLPLNLTFEKGSHEVSFQFLGNKDTINRTHRVLFENDINKRKQPYQVFYLSDNPMISYIEL